MELFVALLELCVAVGVAVGIVALVRKLPIAKEFKGTNDVAGFYITIIGTIYAVILAFMLFAVWTRFDTAVDTVDQEANALTDLFRLAVSLPNPERFQIQETARTYAESVIGEEWATMRHRQPARQTVARYDRLWLLITQIRAGSPHDQVIIDHMLTRLTDMAAARRSRLLKARTGLPGILWFVMIAGGFITVAFSAFFGVERFALHAFKASVLTITIFIVLYATAEINGPFRGNVSVSPGAFEQAIGTLKHVSAGVTPLNRRAPNGF